MFSLIVYLEFIKRMHRKFFSNMPLTGIDRNWKKRFSRRSSAGARTRCQLFATNEQLVFMAKVIFGNSLINIMLINYLWFKTRNATFTAKGTGSCTTSEFRMRFITLAHVISWEHNYCPRLIRECFNTSSRLQSLNRIHLVEQSCEKIIQWRSTLSGLVWQLLSFLFFAEKPLTSAECFCFHKLWSELSFCKPVSARWHS